MLLIAFSPCSLNLSIVFQKYLHIISQVSKYSNGCIYTHYVTSIYPNCVACNYAYIVTCIEPMRLTCIYTDYVPSIYCTVYPFPIYIALPVFWGTISPDHRHITSPVLKHTVSPILAHIRLTSSAVPAHITPSIFMQGVAYAKTNYVYCT